MCMWVWQKIWVKRKKKKRLLLSLSPLGPSRQGQLAPSPESWETERAPLYWHQHASHTDCCDTAAALLCVGMCVLQAYCMEEESWEEGETWGQGLEGGITRDKKKTVHVISQLICSSLGACVFKLSSISACYEPFLLVKVATKKAKPFSQMSGLQPKWGWCNTLQ